MKRSLGVQINNGMTFASLLAKLIHGGQRHFFIGLPEVAQMNAGQMVIVTKGLYQRFRNPRFANGDIGHRQLVVPFPDRMIIVASAPASKG
jgi:hypothetical protein